MEAISYLVELIMHIDHHINSLVSNYGTWSYLILFLIIFCETGLVIMPFLPGDSLLFVLGALAAREGAIEAWPIFILLSVAAISGNILNYQIGRLIAPRIFRDENIRFLNKEHLLRTQAFFDKHGAKTIIITRFMPILRTCAPFLAGVGNMPYGRFIAYNIVGGIVWVGLFIASGYFFGQIPWVEHNFSKVILLIIVVSFIPAVVEYCRHHKPQS